MLHKAKAAVGPNLSKGVILLTFYEKRENKALFGLLRSEEKVCFERWKIPVIIDEREFPRSSQSSMLPNSISDQILRGTESETMNELDRNYTTNRARYEVQQRILSILEVNYTEL